MSASAGSTAGHWWPSSPRWPQWRGCDGGDAMARKLAPGTHRPGGRNRLSHRLARPPPHHRRPRPGTSRGHGVFLCGPVDRILRRQRPTSTALAVPTRLVLLGAPQPRGVTDHRGRCAPSTRTLQRLDPKHSSSTRPSGHLPGQASGAGQHHPVLLNVRSAAACLHRQVPAAALGIPVTGAHDDASIDHTSTFRTSHLHALILPSKTPQHYWPSPPESQ